MTDNELVQQVLAGNENACRFLVVKYQKLVFHIVRRVINQQEELEDLCQDIFMKVFSQLKTYRGNSKLSTWIATISYNTSITCYNRMKRSSVVGREEFDRLPESEHQTGNTGQEVEFSELKSYLLKYIETLPVHYRTVLTLFYLEEFSYREIEEITGMPEGTIKSYLSRARVMMKAKLENMQHHEKARIFEKI